MMQRRLYFQTDSTGGSAPEITDEQFKGWIGEVVDDRLAKFNAEMDTKLKKLDILDSLTDTIGGLFEQHKTTPTEFDRGGFLKDIENLIDNKIRGLSGGTATPTVTGRKKGPLSRAIFGD